MGRACRTNGKNRNLYRHFVAKIRRKETTRPGIILKWIIER
jgi:hypothetical protein